MQNFVQHWREGCQVPTDGERRAEWAWRYFAGGYAPMPTLFAERLAEQKNAEKEKDSNEH